MSSYVKLKSFLERNRNFLREKETKFSTNLIQSCRITWLKLSPTTMPMQLPKPKPPSQKDFGGSSAFSATPNQIVRHSCPRSSEAPARSGNCLACEKFDHWRSECSQDSRSGWKYAAVSID